MKVRGADRIGDKAILYSVLGLKQSYYNVLLTQ